MERLLWIFAGICLPIAVFYPNSPNVTFGAIGLLSLGLVLVRKDLHKLSVPLSYLSIFLCFIAWALIACWWSPVPGNSLLFVGRIVLAVLCGISFYAARTEFMGAFVIGYYVAIGLLILDEVLGYHILRSLRGQDKEAPEFYAGVTLLVLSLWPVLNAIKNRPVSSKVFVIACLGLGVYEMTDHAAKLALIAGIVAWGIAYLSPKWILRAAGVLSAIIMLGFPFALIDMDPVEILNNNKSMMIKSSYTHRLFILQRVTNTIFEQPWIGHGLNAYRSYTRHDKDTDVFEELAKVYTGQPFNAEALGEAVHPHNLSLQVWVELGLVGALLYALFLLISLWRLSNIPGARYERATFVGMYTSIFVIAHVSFNAWTTWWLIGLSILLAIILLQINNQKEKLAE